MIDYALHEFLSSALHWIMSCMAHGFWLLSWLGIGIPHMIPLGHIGEYRWDIGRLDTNY